MTNRSGSCRCVLVASTARTDRWVTPLAAKLVSPAFSCTTLLTRDQLSRDIRYRLPALIHDDSGNEPEGVAVYTLSDPRSIRDIRYVGLTRHPKQRFCQHIDAAGSASQRHEWTALWPLYINGEWPTRNKPVVSRATSVENQTGVPIDLKRIHRVSMSEKNSWHHIRQSAYGTPRDIGSCAVHCARSCSLSSRQLRCYSEDTTELPVFRDEDGSASAGRRPIPMRANSGCRSTY